MLLFCTKKKKPDNNKRKRLDNDNNKNSSGINSKSDGNGGPTEEKKRKEQICVRSFEILSLPKCQRLVTLAFHAQQKGMATAQKTTKWSVTLPNMSPALKQAQEVGF